MLLVLGAMVDALRARSLSAWRGLSFVLLTSATAILLCGLPEFLLGITDERVFLPLKLSLGPLTGALSLTYLGVWLGLNAQDRLIKVLILVGSILSLIAGTGAVAWYIVYPATSAKALLLVSALVSAVSPLIAFIVGLRGILLGDHLAHWMVFATVFLAITVSALYSISLGVDYGGAMQVLTACSTVVYLVIVSTVTHQRNKILHRLKKLSLGQETTDEITGLPTGSVLLSKVDDAMWRSIRVGRETAVVAVWMNNLYALSDQAGLHIEHEIRARLTANVRRAMGSRSVVGLMQARCFLTAISAVQDRAEIEKKAQRLITRINMPMVVGEFTGEPFSYAPEIGVGVVYIPHRSHGDPLAAMDLAQNLALTACKEKSKLLLKELEPVNQMGSTKPTDLIRSW